MKTSTDNVAELKAQMKLAADEIFHKILEGKKITQEDRKFFNAYLAISGGNAFNAGKRKPQKTGKG